MSEPELVKTSWMLIPAGDLPLEVTEGRLEEAPGLKALQAIIDPLLDGADLEHVTVLAAFEAGGVLEALDMFVSERGHLDGLPRNNRATAIYRQATMLGESAAPTPHDPEELPFIAGPAVLFNRRVWL